MWQTRIFFLALISFAGYTHSHTGVVRASVHVCMRYLHDYYDMLPVRTTTFIITFWHEVASSRTFIYLLPARCRLAPPVVYVDACFRNNITFSEFQNKKKKMIIMIIIRIIIKMSDSLIRSKSTTSPCARNTFDVLIKCPVMCEILQ